MQIIDEDEFRELYYEASIKNDLSLIKKICSSDFFINSPIKFKQDFMSNLVVMGYLNEDIGKWALTNSMTGVIGDVSYNCNAALRIASKENINYAKFLLTSKELKKRANINAVNDESSALLAAIKESNIDFVKYLLTSPELKTKASLLKSKKIFDDPLCNACGLDNNEIIKYLLTDLSLKEKADISRFDYAALKSIIQKDNIKIFNFLIENNLIDVNANKENYYAEAIIADSVNIVNKVESYFEVSPDLNTFKYKDKSLFFSIAKNSHYTRRFHHFYLHHMIYTTLYNPSEEERKEMNHFYLYGKNDSSISLDEVLKKRDEKQALEELLQQKNIKKVKRKI